MCVCVCVCCFLQIIYKMIDVLSKEAKSCTKKDYRRFSLTDIQLIFSTIYAMVREPCHISLDMLVSILLFQEVKSSISIRIRSVVHYFDF